MSLGKKSVYRMLYEVNNAVYKIYGYRSNVDRAV